MSPHKDSQIRKQLLDLVVENAAGWLLEDVRVGSRQAEVHFPCALEQFAHWLRQRAGHVWSRVDAGTTVLLRARRTDVAAWRRFCAAWVARSTLAADRPSLRALGRLALWHPEPEPIYAPCGKYVQVSASVTGSPVLVESVVLRRAMEWVVSDVRIDGRSCFGQEGDIPGMTLETLASYDLNLGVAAQDVCLAAYYIGADLGDQVLHADVLVAAVAGT